MAIVIPVFWEVWTTSTARLVILQEFVRAIPENSELPFGHEFGLLTNQDECHAFQRSSKIKLEPVNLRKVNIIYSFHYQIVELREQLPEEAEPQPYLMYAVVRKTSTSVRGCHFVVIKKIKKDVKFFDLDSPEDRLMLYSRQPEAMLRDDTRRKEAEKDSNNPQR